MPLEITRQLDDPRLRLGVCELAGVRIGPASAALRERAAAFVERLRAEGFALAEAQRSAVRQCLKGGGFSPTGRNRPAQELLLNDLAERDASAEADAVRGFRHISNAVDVNNLTSLELRLPISLLDSGQLEGRAVLRYGREGEGYVFNPSGHSIDLKRCVVIARGAGEGEAVGSPIKDSMAAKVYEGAAGLLGVIYAPSESWGTEALLAATDVFSAALAAETGGHVVQTAVL